MSLHLYCYSFLASRTVEETWTKQTNNTKSLNGWKRYSCSLPFVPLHSQIALFRKHDHCHSVHDISVVFSVLNVWTNQSQLDISVSLFLSFSRRVSWVISWNVWLCTCLHFSSWLFLTSKPEKFVRWVLRRPMFGGLSSSSPPLLLFGYCSGFVVLLLHYCEYLRFDTQQRFFYSRGHCLLFLSRFARSHSLTFLRSLCFG